MNKVKVTEEQRTALHKIWFVYGNRGKKHSHCNHRLIQNLLEHGDNTKDFYLQDPKNDLTQECIDEVEKILKG